MHYHATYILWNTMQKKSAPPWCLVVTEGLITCTQILQTLTQLCCQPLSSTTCTTCTTVYNKLGNCESKTYSQSSVGSIPEKQHVSQSVLHHLDNLRRETWWHQLQQSRKLNEKQPLSKRRKLFNQLQRGWLTSLFIAFSLTLKAVRAKAFPHSPRIAVRSCDVGIHSLAAGWLRLQPRHSS